MRKNTIKKLLLGILATITAAGGYAAYYVHEAIANRNIMRPCDLQVVAHPNEDSAKFLLPCYQIAAQDSPNNQQTQYTLGCVLIRTGRYDEARPIFEKLSHSWGSAASDARQMLLPGAMQRQKEMDDQAQRNQHARLALTVKNNAEEANFLRLHAVVRRGRIIRMSEQDKVVWLAMRDRHQQQTNALIGYRKP